MLHNLSEVGAALKVTLEGLVTSLRMKAREVYMFTTILTTADSFAGGIHVARATMVGAMRTIH